MRRRILLVEDDPKTREMVALYLQREGYEVATAEDGVRALEVAKEREPHLVVLDLMLPRMDGLAVCRALRDVGRASARPGIIMVTARTTEDDKLAGLDLGADDYVTKPFSPRSSRSSASVPSRSSSCSTESVSTCRMGASIAFSASTRSITRRIPMTCCASLVAC